MGMNKKLLLVIILIWASACETAPGQRPDPTYDPATDVRSFLATQNPDEERRILEKLDAQSVDNEIIKTILRALPKETSGPTPDLELSVEGKKYDYALYVPEANTETKSGLPLIVVLHGMGGNGAATLQAWKERLGDEFIIACPSYPMGAWWSLRAETLVLQLIRHLQSRYAVDGNRVFLAGLSNGAIGAYMIGMNYPDRFAGIVPIAGAITERYMHFLVNLRNTPVYMIQGALDPVFPIQYTRRIYKILGDMKYPVVYREHQEQGAAHGGHFLPASEMPELIKWMRKQKRELHPAVLRMTREANHLNRIGWARLARGKNLAALQLPGPENESINVKEGNIATLFATNAGKNSIDVMGQNIVDYEIYLSADSVDFATPIRITTQDIVIDQNRLIPGEKRISFFAKVAKSREVLLREYKADRDPHLLFDAKIAVTGGENLEIASLP
jgi:predicted esterase